MNNLYPAIDLYEGKVVRLVRGDFQQLTVYSHDPGAQAQEWEKQGAQWLHVVDLEGAKTGHLKNLSSLLEIRNRVNCKIQFGGGLRSIEQIRQVLDAGVNRIVLGTKALDEKFLESTLKEFGNQLAVGLDVRNGMVQTQGWLQSGGEQLELALQRFNEFPIETIIYTDIQKDGMLAGPNFSGLLDVLAASRANIILSGGISSMQDIHECAKIKQRNFEGPIIGKALYEKKIDLRSAVELLNTWKH